jgi:hypothetical protein
VKANGLAVSPGAQLCADADVDHPSAEAINAAPSMRATDRSTHFDPITRPPGLKRIQPGR